MSPETNNPFGYPNRTGASTRRQRTHEILDISMPHDKVGRIIDGCLITLIALNVAAVIFETLPGLDQEWLNLFYWFEVFSIIIFSFEYVLRVWSSVDDDEIDYRHPILGRLRYMLSPMALIDLFVILPFYLGFFIQFDLRFLRVLRLLRIFKLTRYSSSMSLLLNVLRDEGRAIGAAMFVLMLMLVLTASLAYLAEHKAQPEAFGSIPAAMWWAVVTMTTVGYGDVVPVTLWGKLMGAAIGILGIGMVALPAGLLSSGFSNELHRRRKKYTDMVETALEDGVISDEEEVTLKEVREDLGIRAQDAREILETEMRFSGDIAGKCPHCGKALKIPTEG
ncbi:MAG: ion transporter [Rhodospirillaceae bacterium]|nr:ion transporter [Rhodospirillaceae bacterium]MBT5244945.1 ion transporter [Rhodospirillaceae bacterium]MBT5562664.1 ion transporter [Rhodospirillaceae bacterium]MBT6243026.1 ion transporter [Rhodospirillaceae bacterium]MBT7137154.1 ion transporter [Rhodospirillaceae bacterium]